MVSHITLRIFFEFPCLSNGATVEKKKPSDENRSEIRPRKKPRGGSLKSCPRTFPLIASLKIPEIYSSDFVFHLYVSILFGFISGSILESHIWCREHKEATIREILRQTSFTTAKCNDFTWRNSIILKGLVLFFHLL